MSGRPVDLGPAKRRTVLAALLVDAGRWVTAETLIDRVWGDAPPAQVRATLYAHITRIRRVLVDQGPHLRGGADGPSEAPSLRRGAGGYRLDVPPDLVDVHRFRRLVTRARRSDRSDAVRVATLREAMGLWRGDPLAGLTGDWAARTRESWLHQRVDAVLAWADAELRVGGHVVVIDTLSVLVAEHPLIEPLTSTLMRALHAAGRASEALACYAALRKRLADELGATPGVEARREHQSILSGKAAPPAVRPAPPAAVGRPAVVPAQLPLEAAGFTGREEELNRLEKILVASAERPTAVVVSAVSGTAGVGKTALAVHWAHRARDRFPDGQLYVNLRGYDPDRPMTAPDALTRFLTALGVPGQDIPLEADDRAARYRTAVAGRRMLIVLDNAATVEQVRPLLPGTGSCAVLVTSRDSLAGLVAREGAHRLDLDLLPADAAHTLLRRLVGPRAEAEPDAVSALAAQCARLPLALRVAAELAAARPATPLTDLVGELADQQRRLDLLDADGDPRAAVAAVFSWSLRHLPTEVKRAFRLLGLHPGPDFDVHAAAALTGGGVADTRRALDVLARAHLVLPVEPARYGMHDLLRAYATRLAMSDDTPQAREAALDRLFDHYLATAAAAMNCLHPAEAHLRPAVPEPAASVPDLSGPEAARSWLDAERACLAAMSAHTAAHGRPTHAIRLSLVLYRYLISGYHTDGLTMHGHARDAARRIGDPLSEARALLGLGTASYQLARHEPARRHLQDALTLFRRSGDPTGQARALVNLGLVDERLGRFLSAVEYLEQALVLYRSVGDRSGEAIALKDLASVEGQSGRYQEAADHLRQALALLRRTGNRYLEAHALNDLGSVEARLDLLGSAADHQEQALVLLREVGDRYGEAGALHDLGIIHTRRDQPAQAAECHRQALALYSGNGDRNGEARARNGLGEAARAAGRPADALVHHTDALAIAEDIGSPGQQARALGGLGDAHHALGDTAAAVGRYERALALYTRLGMPEADAVRRRLASATGPRP
ncbi:tetratricopeptide (TPR) repeat protein/DNA-binding SARP family transcriptional activator [Streptomyces sp. 3330]|uniref:AfsR/SARP family transcriptional regulator n=1 Tax=Streptomyces sp. 3330 TaxID=2817755 RepID=UPI002858B62E|nr:tetratricopeptide repeat protein [Streptomyces sp. 3330]MDR6975057.1 tetratricopeptide (TPR) repeat protein/DNA-binding SARP family transcriptional activator [Streptomyces sp. 3330]